MLETYLDAQRQRLLSALNVSLASGTDRTDAAVARLALVAAQIQVRLVILCGIQLLTSSGEQQAYQRSADTIF